MIRKARQGDLMQIQSIYEKARQLMRYTGNATQWVDGYPSEEIIRNDIRQGNFYVEEIKGEITGCFAYIVGEEPTYQQIDGNWLDEEPYGTIHRLASSGCTGGVADRCFEFCRSITPNLRADTHENNKIMQRLLLRNGFRYCGIIRVTNGSERLAYQLSETMPVTSPTKSP